MRYGAELYGTLEAETGQATGWQRSGSLRLASSAARWQELRRSATMAKGFDFHVDLVSPTEARDLFPLLDLTGVVGAAWIEGDGYADPASLTAAYAAGARSGGASLLQQVRVTGIRTQRRRVTSVVTDAGEIATECVIDAAGMWGGEIAAMVGTRVPACAVEHQYLVTAKSDRIPAGLPSTPTRSPSAAGSRTRDRGARTEYPSISAPNCCSPISIGSRHWPKPRRRASRSSVNWVSDR